MSVTRSIGVAALGELDHLVEDAAVRVAEEIARVDDLGGEVERVVVQQDRAEHGALGFEIVRQRAFGDGDVGHARRADGELTEKKTSERDERRITDRLPLAVTRLRRDSR